VSSLIPKEMLPEDVEPKTHRSGSVKSSLNMTSPRFGGNSGVGVLPRSGIMVGVVVGGNHSTVAVGEDVDVAVGVNSTLGCRVWVGAQAENIIISINPLKVKLWIR
jgi:hypothetical protein